MQIMFQMLLHHCILYCIQSQADFTPYFQNSYSVFFISIFSTVFEAHRAKTLGYSRLLCILNRSSSSSEAILIDPVGPAAQPKKQRKTTKNKQKSHKPAMTVSSSVNHISGTCHWVSITVECRVLSWFPLVSISSIRLLWFAYLNCLSYYLLRTGYLKFFYCKSSVGWRMIKAVLPNSKDLPEDIIRKCVSN